MNLEALRAFLAVAQAGSFSGASKQTGIVRSTLARRVEALEDHLGVRLVTSDDRGVSLTARGERLAHEGPQVLEAAERAEAVVRDKPPRLGGTLHGIMPEGTPSAMVAERLAAVGVAFPELTLTIESADSPVEALEQGGDFALHWGTRPTGGPWITKLIRRVPFRLLATPSYLQVHGEPETLEALDGHALYLSDVDGQPRGRLPLQAGGSHSAAARVISRNFHTLASLARAGRGIAWVPALRGPADDGATDAVVTVLADVVVADVPMWVVAPKTMATHPVVMDLDVGARRFLDPLLLV